MSSLESNVSTNTKISPREYGGNRYHSMSEKK